MSFNSGLFGIIFVLCFVIFGENCFANLPKNHFIDKSKVLLLKKPEDSWFADDKYQHVMASAFLMGISYNIARVEGKISRKNAIVVGCSFSFSLGILKEWRDYVHPKGVASFKDLAANALGIGLGILCFTDHLEF